MKSLKCISFIESGNTSQGHFFYLASTNGDYDKIHGMKELTLSKAISILQSQGVDPIRNTKVSITVYYN